MNSNIYAIVTGSGAGLGKALAEELAKRKHSLILLSLPGEGLKETAKAVSEKYGVLVEFYEADISKPGAPETFHRWVKERGFKINILINNAGLGHHGNFDESKHEMNSTLLMLNVFATYTLTHAFLPDLKENKISWILNVGSMAGITPTPYKALYSASKSFISTLSLSLHHELKKFGIHVSCLAPGAVLTNEKVKARIKAVGWIGRRNAMTPESVAEITIRKMFRGRSLIVPGFSSNLGYYLFKYLPAWLTLRGLERRMKNKSE